MWTTYYNGWHLENAQMLPILLFTVYILLLILILRSHGTCPSDEDLVWEGIPYTKKLAFVHLYSIFLIILMLIILKNITNNTNTTTIYMQYIKYIVIYIYI